MIDGLSRGFHNVVNKINKKQIRTHIKVLVQTKTKNE